MRFFDNSLKRLVIIGMNDLACEAAKFCRTNDIEVAVISGPRFRELPSLEKGFSTCYERMESMSVEVNEFSKIDRQSLSKYFCKDCAVFSFDSPFIIKQEVIDLFGGVLFNEHGAHLPYGKGGGGFSWRIMENDREGNVLFHVLVENLDAGPIVHQSSFIFPETCRKPVDYMGYQHRKNTGELTIFLSLLIDNKDLQLVEQNSHFESYMPRLHTPSQSFLDWSWRAEFVHRFILAFSAPYEGAKTYINGKKIFLYDSYLDTKQIHSHPYKYGIIFSVDGRDLKVVANDGTVVITDYEVEDNYKPHPGDRLYTPVSLMDNIFSSRVIYTAKGLKRK